MGSSSGNQVVSVLTFYANNLSSNPAEDYSLSVKFAFDEHKIKQKEAVVRPFFVKNCRFLEDVHL